MELESYEFGDITGQIFANLRIQNKRYFCHPIPSQGEIWLLFRENNRYGEVQHYSELDFFKITDFFNEEMRLLLLFPEKLIDHDSWDQFKEECRVATSKRQ